MPDQPTRRTRIGLLAAAGVILVAGAKAASRLHPRFSGRRREAGRLDRHGP